MKRRRLSDLIPEPAKRVVRPLWRRVRPAVSPTRDPEQHGASDRQRNLAHARRRIRMLKRRTGSDEKRWARQLDTLVPRRMRPLAELAYFPAGNWNAYMRLLYARCPEFGFEPRPLDRIKAVDDLPPTSVLHLHWTRAAQVGAGSVVEAEQKTKAFLDPIERFVGRGGVLVWTIHEALAHDCAYPDIEVGLRRRLAALAHGIHILHPSAFDTVGEQYPLDPAKVFVVEHPLYTGAYDDYVSRETARAVLDIPGDAVLLLGFGAIRPYKGFDRLVRSLPAVRRDTGRDVRVMIAGRTLEADDNTDLRELVAATAGATMTEDGPPDGAVQILFRAADLVVLPYRELHNSGVMLLALTFGVPVVAPKTSLSEDMANLGVVTLFEMGSDDDLAAALVAAIETSSPVGSPPAKVLERFGPSRIAGEFGEHLRHVVDRARRR